MEPIDAALPRYDFYQSSTHLILSLYIKGYNAPEVVDQTDITISEDRVRLLLPPLPASSSAASSSSSNPAPQRFTFYPLYSSIRPCESTSRILGSKIELKLAKSSPDNWPTLLRADSAADPKPSPNTITSQTPTAPADSPTEAPVGPKKKEKKNWDKLVEDDEDGKDGDGNAGGDAALQKLFSTIYKDADPDTRRAMIKSYTESGGTTLSTDWSKIGKDEF